MNLLIKFMNFLKFIKIYELFMNYEFINNKNMQKTIFFHFHKIFILI